MTEWIWTEAQKDTIDWDAGSRVHNWRRYIGEKTQAIWRTLTPEQKYAIIYDADEMSMREDWD